jgi:hypothetical protein
LILSLPQITNQLASTVRFKQNVNTTSFKLDSDLVSPSDARLVDHALFREQNLSSIIPDFQNYTTAVFVPTETYDEGALVQEGADLYESLADTNLGNLPSTSPTQWLLTNYQSNYLRNLRKEAVRNVISLVSNAKKNERITKEMLDRLNLYTGTGSLSDRIIKTGRLVGLAINVLDSTNLKIALDRVMTQFDTAQDGIELYLYHSSSPVPLATILVDQATPVRQEWHELTDVNLYSESIVENIVGGTYFLMYDEDQVTGQAINYRHTFGVSPCRGCSKYNYESFDKYSQYVKFRSVFISAQDRPASAAEMFDIDRLNYQADTTYGLNLQVSTYCDLTDYILSHKAIFADAIKNEVLKQLLSELASSTRSNVVNEKARDLARQALQNASLGGENVTRMAEKSLDALAFELSDIQNSVCMPKIDSKGIQIKGIRSGNAQKTY